MTAVAKTEVKEAEQAGRIGTGNVSKPRVTAAWLEDQKEEK